MKYEIVGGQLPVVVCKLDKNEKMFTESGGMCWMDDGFDMDSNTRGGLMKGIGRAFSGESIFMTTYTSPRDQAEIAFGSSFPGKIVALTLAEGESKIVQKSAFLAAEDTIQLTTFFRKRLGAGIFGGEGFILQKIQGPGTVFLEIDGDVVEKELAPGELIKVDQGYVAIFEESVQFEITTVKGLKNKFLSGEGFFLATLQGPGKVWLQTMPFTVLADRIINVIPHK
ncbi:TIGR00266 family protein [Amedibacillus sp. YH-ame10]